MTASAHARLLIIGIWTEAWDDGVFEWKPISLKARLFPADNVDISGLLSELTELNFVKTFSVGGRKLGAIRNFRKFQRPKKPNSSLVLPSDLRTYVAIDDDGSPPVPNQDGTDTENHPQMEDGGCRGGGKENNLDSAKPAAQAGPSRAKQNLEQKLRSLVGQEPVALSQDFFEIQRLIDDGMTETDVLEGVIIALARSNGRIRSWKQFENWIRNAAKDRLARIPRPANGAPLTPAAPYEPTIDLGGEFRAVPLSNIPGIVKLFVERGQWVFPSPRPGEQGCLIPDEFLPERLRSTASAA